MRTIKSFLIGIITFINIAIILFIGFGTLTVINSPRIIIKYRPFKRSLHKFSNLIGDLTVKSLAISIQFLHQKRWEFIIEDEVSMDEWYLATSNHASWGDVFCVLAATNFKAPLFKIFMKKDLWWLPPVFLANVTLNMPFVNRHSKQQLEKNPNLRKLDYQNTIASCKRFERQPTTIFSFAEGTRNNPKKHAEQNSPYKNLLAPKIGGIALGLSAVPKIDYLLDFTIVYKSKKRSFWDFCIGNLSDVKVFVKKLRIPESLKRRDYLNDPSYRTEFRDWLDNVWIEKDELIDSVNF